MGRPSGAATATDGGGAVIGVYHGGLSPASEGDSSMLFHQSEPEQKAIECKFPAAFVTHQLRDLLDCKLPELNALDPPLIRDTVFNEEGIYFWTPVELSPTETGYQLDVRGSVRVWDGTEYVPDGRLTDVLTVELFDDNSGSLVVIRPAFDAFRGFAEHVQALIVHNWGIEDISSKGGRTRLKDLSEDEKEWRREIARQYLERIEDGRCTKSVAADMAGYSRKTLDRWVKKLL
jgi:hypothetical protein